MPRRLIPLLAALLLAFAAAPGSADAARQDRLTPDERLELGIKYMNRGYYTKALEQLNRVRNYYRDDPAAIRAELEIANLYYKKAEWDQARVAYEDFQRMHPHHEEIDYVVFRTGLCLWRKAPKVAARDQVWTRQAVNTWSGFAARYPESEWLQDVQENLTEGRNRLAHKEIVIGRFYLRREAWRAAAGRFEGMLRSYPQADGHAEALALLGLCQAHQGDVAAARATLRKLQDEGVTGRQVTELQKLLD
ncbi:MAG: outer membrane protein assembly factor BamD [Pseudomonadota bacterium]